MVRREEGGGRSRIKAMGKYEASMENARSAWGLGADSDKRPALLACLVVREDVRE